jgi:hypothetical protein
LYLYTVEAAKILAGFPLPGQQEKKSREVLSQAPVGSINVPGTDIPGLSKAPRPAAMKSELGGEGGRRAAATRRATRKLSESQRRAKRIGLFMVSSLERELNSPAYI